ncbi:hypothetical protein DIURU_002323 [Diutina rugosa]|uniref:Amino acid permease/ SLC12A domain-containing protein n=1 Tax=Diutina rugosa TaxID=5481 RepID=A0A642UR88_DIURU|nr:uncharacterized protein DIURU_002323 [Diutina rugosa]KAA8903811.1 hypothetical protein DIURU_002323 [Diutina rugosa]
MTASNPAMETDLEKVGIDPYDSKLDHVDSKIEPRYSVVSSDTPEAADAPGAVKRGLKSRQVQMIVLGGTIGTGLFISTGNIIAQAGPGSALIAFLFMTTLCFSVTMSLGEMVAYIPITGSFAQFATRWVSPAIGAANGWNYWFSWVITFALELSIIGDVIGYWTHAVPLWAWITIFFVVLSALNFLPVTFYGEIEFWMALIKVLAVVGWLIYALCMVCGANNVRGAVGFRYWHHPGAWGPGYMVQSDVATGRFLGWLKSLIAAAFTFQGTETVGITAGESKNPRKTLPSAIRKVIWRILIFYVLSIFFIGLLVPYDDPRLSANQPEDSTIAYSATSPFIIAILNSGTNVLDHIFNAVILSTVISAGNSNVYLASRVLYALAESYVAPRFLMWTPYKGVPVLCVAISAAFGALGYLAVNSASMEAFDWLLNISATAGLIAWGWISVCHIRFMNILRSRGIDRKTLPFKAPFMPYAAYYSCFLIFLIVLVNGFDVFWDVTAAGFFTAYISPIFFVFCWLVFTIIFNMPKEGPWHKRFFAGLKGFDPRKWVVPLDECDIDTGARYIEDLDVVDEKPMPWWKRIFKSVF